MARLTLRPTPAIALPGFTIRPGLTIRPELVLRTARRGGPRWKATRLRDLLAGRLATGRPAPRAPVRSVRPGRAPVIAGVLALAVATALVVAVIVRRRRAAATKTEASVAAAAETEAEPALAADPG